MASIYDEIAAWSSSTTYSTNDIVEYPANTSTYWYSRSDANLNSGPSIGNVHWGGNTNFSVGEASKQKTEFIWTPSYNQTTRIAPRVLAVRFGDGYTQRTPDGINNNLITLDMSFEGRSQKETLAIMHFLNTRRAAEAFAYIPPAPFATQKLFIAKKFDSTFIFNDNYNIKATFEETP